MRTTTAIRHRPYSALILSIAILLGASLAATEFVPQYLPSVQAFRTDDKVELDGRLDDAGWRSATHLTNFVERYPGDNTQPSVATEAFITYDESNLYVGFICRDDPSEIRATMCQRDQFFDDDAVAVMIDTYGHANWAYRFYVNPYGIQRDELWSSVAGQDVGFDLIWKAAATRMDDGYQVEIAIPFTSMRFPSQDVQSWKMDFQRIRPREAYHQYAWAAHDRNEQCDPCQWGTVEGISNVKPGKGVEILPAYVANQTSELSNRQSPDSDFENHDPMGEMSVMGKYALSSDVTMEFAGNPDFSQIESDAGQIDVNTTIALFYPERRPFFQEGADIFRTLFNSFYTRTINDPIYAAKLTARKPGFTIGFMSAQDENTPYIIPFDESSSFPLNVGKSVTNALRVSKSVGNDSHLGAIITDRRFEDNGYGTILALDGDIRLSRNYSIDGQFLASYTGEADKMGESMFYEGAPIDKGRYTAEFDGESFQGNAFITRFRRNARNWGFFVDYNQVDPDYRTQTGYDPWVNYRNFSIWNGYTFYPSSGPFQRIQPQLYIDNRWVYDGGRRWQHATFSLWTQLRQAQTSITLSVHDGRAVWAGIEYPDLVSGSIEVNSRPSDKLGLYTRAEYGRTPARFASLRGDELDLELDLEIKPVDRLIFEPEFQYARSHSPAVDSLLYRQFITRARTRFQVNRALSLRLVVEYNDAEQYRRYRGNTDDPAYVYRRTVFVDPLVTYRINSFSVFYVGSTHDYNDYLAGDESDSRWQLRSRQFFMKLQYLFQI
jgi:hypothetical protein